MRNVRNTRNVPLLLAALITAVSLVAVAPASAQAPSSGKDEGARGGIQATLHTHSEGATLFPTDRLSYNFVQGEEFSYSSRTCSGNAPFNDLGLDFRPDYPGVDDDADGTARVRHRVQGTITELSGDGDSGRIEGTITTVLCVMENGTWTESEHVIVTEYSARFRRVSDNEVRLTGHFEISPTSSTGTFADMTGHGSFQGSLVCLGHQRDPSQPTCEQIGEFTDFVGFRGDPTAGPGEIQPGLVGTFRDPTVETL